MNNTFIFKRKPFELCNAPATFQLAMNQIFKKIEKVYVILDDILIYSENIEGHAENLKKYLKKYMILIYLSTLKRVNLASKK